MKFPDIGGRGGGGAGGNDRGLYIKLDDGQKIQGVFRGDPSIFRTHWFGKGKLPVKCVGKETCEHCSGGNEPKFRFAINFVMKEDGVWVAKIFEQGYLLFKDMKALHEGDYNLEETMVSITRSGTELDTEYKILPTKNNGGLTAKDFKAIAAIPLNPLKGDAGESETPPAHTEDDIPF